MTIQDPGDVLREATSVLLDFDGPICSIFGGLPAPDVADELRAIATGTGKRLPPNVQTEQDPLEVLRWGGRLPEIGVSLETALRAAEMRASRTAVPTPGAAEFLVACANTGRPVAVVSNNSAESGHRLPETTAT